MVIYILTKAVEHEFKINNFQTFARMGRMSPTYRHLAIRQIAADQITMDDALEMVNYNTDNSYRVQSFTSQSINYCISLNTDMYISSCTCEDWLTHQLSCKHMFLLIRVHPYISLPSITVALPLESLTSTTTYIPDPDLQNNFNVLLNRIKRIERTLRLQKSNGNISIDTLETLNQKTEEIENILEQLDRRTSFIRQIY